MFPLRDAFVAIFFVSIGLLINPWTLFSSLPVLALMIGLIFIGNFLVWTCVVLAFRYPLWTAVSVAAGLTQIGEFSFVLVQVARNAGIIGADLYNSTLAASLITILLNAALFRATPAILARIRRGGQDRIHSQTPEKSEGWRDHIIICGFGRVGSAIGYALETFGMRYVAIETDPDVLRAIRSRGTPAIFGDCAHIHVLERAGVGHASLLIVTIPHRESARLAIMSARKLRDDLPIMVRAHRREEYSYFMDSGATEVIQPETEASATFIRHACGHYLMIPDSQIRIYLRNFRDVAELSQRRPATAQQRVPEVREVAVLNPSFAGRSLRDLKLREAFGVTVVSIRRNSGESLTNPPAETVLQPDDRLRVLGLPDEIDAFAAQSASAGDSP